MSVTRKIFDGARSGLNSLLDRVSADDTPLSGIDREELDGELARRTAARAAEGGAPRPEENPRARWAGAGEEAARRRREAADTREKRIRAGREKKRRATEAAKEAAWQRFQAEARRQPPPAAGPTGRSSSSGPGPSGARTGGPRRPPGFRPGQDDKIARYYKVLDLPYGADFDQVKSAYRKLMRKYHPDVHSQSPQKQKAATELTVQVTQAYSELETHLLGVPNRKP